MDVQIKEKDGEHWLSTLSIYKNIGLSAHHKLKKKAAKMNLPLLEIEGLGTALNLKNSISILEAYRYTLKDKQLKAVNLLLEKLYLLLQPTKRKKPAPATTALKVSSPSVDLSQPVGSVKATEVNQSVESVAPLGRPVNQRVAPSQPSGKEGNPLVQPTAPVGSPKVEQGNQSVDPTAPSGAPVNPPVAPEQPKSTDKSSKKPNTKSPPKIRSQPKHNALARILLRLPEYIRTEYFIFMVLIFAIGIQVHHTAELYLRVSEDSNRWVGVVTAYIFGTVSELTALLLTVHQGNRKMLKTFGFFSFWINLLYYQVWEGFAWTPEYVTHLISEVTLSGFIAFVIFIYAHLFTLDVFKKEKTKSQP